MSIISLILFTFASKISPSPTSINVLESSSEIPCPNAAKAEYELTTEQQNTIDSINDAKQAIEDLNAARNESMASINGEFGYIDKLKEEYNGLIDANGSVKEGYEDRGEGRAYVVFYRRFREGRGNAKADDALLVGAEP